MSTAIEPAIERIVSLLSLGNTDKLYHNYFYYALLWKLDVNVVAGVGLLDGLLAPAPGPPHLDLLRTCSSRMHVDWYTLDWYTAHCVGQAIGIPLLG
jgi:hypothetical protein